MQVSIQSIQLFPPKASKFVYHALISPSCHTIVLFLKEGIRFLPDQYHVEVYALSRSNTFSPQYRFRQSECMSIGREALVDEYLALVSNDAKTELKVFD